MRFNTNMFGVKTIFFLLLIISLIMSNLFFRLTKEGKSCDATAWAVRDVEQIVSSTIRKVGTIPNLLKADTREFSLEQYNFTLNEQVADWDVRQVKTTSYFDWPDSWTDNYYSYTFTLDVLYIDGSWQTYEWEHTRYGSIFFCGIPPITSDEWVWAPKFNRITRTSDGTLLDSQQFEFGEGQRWHYVLYEQDDDTPYYLSIETPTLLSQKNLDDFSTYNRAIGEQLAEVSFWHVQVLFENPISIQNLQQIAVEHKIDSMTAFVMASTMFGETAIWPLEVSKGEQLTANLEYTLNNEPWEPSTGYQESDIFVTSFAAHISPSTYKTLLQHDNTLLIDLTPTLAIDGLKSAIDEEINLDNLLFNYAPVGKIVHLTRQNE